MTNTTTISKTLTKYAGSKNRYIDQYAFNDDFDIYVEPCVGMGAMFVHIFNKFGNTKQYWINDLNPYLVEVYTAIRDTPDAVIEIHNTLFDEFAALPLNIEIRKQAYYSIRDSMTNEWLERSSPAERAAYWMFMQNNSFNGIQKYNAEKGIHSSAGTLNALLKTRDDVIMEWHQALQNARITSLPAIDVIAAVDERSLVFVDPPYRGTDVHYGFKTTDDEHIALIRAMAAMPNSCEGFYCNMKTDADDTFYDQFQSQNMIVTGFGNNYMNKIGNDVVLHRPKIKPTIMTLFASIVAHYRDVSVIMLDDKSHVDVDDDHIDGTDDIDFDDDVFDDDDVYDDDFNLDAADDVGDIDDAELTPREWFESRLDRGDEIHSIITGLLEYTGIPNISTLGKILGYSELAPHATISLIMMGRQKPGPKFIERLDRLGK